MLIWDFVPDTGSSEPEPQSGDTDTGLIPNIVGGVIDTVQSVFSGVFGTGIFPNAVGDALNAADGFVDKLF
jgi:hypothetical protein